ncbi:MAG: hypothetical protein Q4G03_08025 [Planctomycetia bacterium]|nr:hypothetical protein [Planctomycetia bacterium]
MNGQPKRNGLTDTKKEQLFDDFLEQRLETDLDAYLASMSLTSTPGDSTNFSEDDSFGEVASRWMRQGASSIVRYIALGVVSLLFLGVVSYSVFWLFTRTTSDVTDEVIVQVDLTPHEIESYPSLYLTSTAATLDYMDRHNISDIEGIYQESAQGISNAVDTYFPRTYAAFQRLQVFANKDTTNARYQVITNDLTDEEERINNEWSTCVQLVRSSEVVDFYLQNDPIAKLATVFYNSDID